MNESLNGSQSRERPRRAVRAASHSPVTRTMQKRLNFCWGVFAFVSIIRLGVAEVVTGSPNG